MKNIILLSTLFFIINLQSQNKIKKIEFSSEGYASAPDYDLIIYCNKTAIFNARSDNYKNTPNGETVWYGTNTSGVNIRTSEVKGLFISRLDNKLYKKISNLILSLDEEFTEGKYIENNLHASIGKLKVTYQNGEIRSIYDYGKKGTSRLIKLYTVFDDLRFNRKWE
ncbi:MAG: hypothetical protein GW839_09715 [Flavobacteriales bacterium]|nr:hypothetical protein [Flavobacteriia bacterium]NCP06875.1 hypothetical protein [Flavobacteriales bacterium]PIV93632.1 MAG: hypothetical protein COW44_08475 [Flavobacteriaceae bacterium CG17_big_fil_post_rev_8_21_14_2_50_33_15]NCP51486.1 hypothetical protein [Flavobacteriales bacterium]NCP60559.1 hypothetical protein [Flavobacteriales bacterium]